MRFRIKTIFLAAILNVCSADGTCEDEPGWFIWFTIGYTMTCDSFDPQQRDCSTWTDYTNGDGISAYEACCGKYYKSLIDCKHDYLLNPFILN